VVEDLRAKGVTFEQYDIPGTTRDGDIHVIGDMRGVWFKDPDGNIIGPCQPGDVGLGRPTPP
jgi:hypothetical protein